MTTNKEVALQAYQKRVMLEKDGLQNKIERLALFLDSDLVEDIDPDEHADLLLQLGVMRQYYGILSNRVHRFK